MYLFTSKCTIELFPVFGYYESRYYRHFVRAFWCLFHLWKFQNQATINCDARSENSCGLWGVGFGWEWAGWWKWSPSWCERRLRGKIVRSCENFLANRIGTMRQIDEQTGQEIYSQTQKLISLEITSRPQLHFSSRPRKAAEPGGRHQDLPPPPSARTIDLPWPWPISKDHSPERVYLENWWTFYWNPHLRPLLRFPTAREREKLKDKRPSCLSF